MARSSNAVDVSIWNWEDCYMWFDNVHKYHQLPFHRFRPSAFQTLNGYHLLQFTAEDFEFIVPGYGPLFFVEFKRLLLFMNNNPGPELAEMLQSYDIAGVPKEELDIYLNLPKQGGDWLKDLMPKPIYEMTTEGLKCLVKNSQTSQMALPAGASADCMGAESFSLYAGLPSGHYQPFQASPTPPAHEGIQYINKEYVSASSPPSPAPWPPMSSEAPICTGPFAGISSPEVKVPSIYNQNFDPLNSSQCIDNQQDQNFCVFTTSPNTSRPTRRKEYSIEPWQFVVLTLLKGKTDLVKWENKQTYGIILVDPQALTDLWNNFYRGSYPEITSIVRNLRFIYPTVDQQGSQGQLVYRLEPTAIQYLHTMSRHGPNNYYP